MNRRRVGEDRGSKETDRCPLTLGANREGALGTNGEEALGANREGALKVSGGALKVGDGVLAGASMDVEKVCRIGSIDCSLSDGGPGYIGKPSFIPITSPTLAFSSSSCSLFSGLFWRGWNTFVPLVYYNNYQSLGISKINYVESFYLLKVRVP
jgi:hypothetical protein